MNQAPPPVGQALKPEDADFGLYPAKDEFKGLDPELWIEFAVRQCLAAQVQDYQKYILAVDNLEATMITRVTPEYFEIVDGERERLKEERGIKRDEENMLLLAKFKFRELLKMIDKRRPKDAVFNL